MIAPVGNKGAAPMTHDTGLLNDTELVIVLGGASPITIPTSTGLPPHFMLPRVAARESKQLTPEETASLIAYLKSL
jgi:hypothetical protein